MPKNLKSTSKFLSLVLRHRPEAIGLRLDTEGWASIEDLVRLAVAHGRSLSREFIAEVVRTSEKQRFRMKDDPKTVSGSPGWSRHDISCSRKKTDVSSSFCRHGNEGAADDPDRERRPE